MHTSRMLARFGLAVGFLLATAPVLGQLANRVFVSARTGNNANACDSVSAPCQTFAGAVLKLNPGGEVIVLDTGGYGPVTITQSVTIEAAPGVTAFIHPPSGNAVTVNAPGATVTLRGLVLNGGASNGVDVQAIGTLSIENLFITGFNSGIHMGVGGHMHVKNTDVKSCVAGVFIDNSNNLARVSIDHCHLDANTYGFLSQTIGLGTRSITMANNSTADGNSQDGWVSGNFTSGTDILHLESCSGSQNLNDGLRAAGTSAVSHATLSNCVFVDNFNFAIENVGQGALSTRGNNTVLYSSVGITGTFPPL